MEPAHPPKIRGLIRPGEALAGKPPDGAGDATLPPSAWEQAFALLPVCPNPHHDHAGKRTCTLSRLPLPAARTDRRLPDGPPVPLYNSLHEVSGVDLSGTQGTFVAFIKEAAAAYFEREQQPVAADLRTRLAALRERASAERQKAVCPHPVTERTHTVHGGQPVSICTLCGAELSTGKAL